MIVIDRFYVPNSVEAYLKITILGPHDMYLNLRMAKYVLCIRIALLKGRHVLVQYYLIV